MKRRLFWKILVGFWLTFFFISQGIWLLFMLFRPSTDTPNYGRSMELMVVSAAATAIRLGGEQSFLERSAAWPPEQRSHLRVKRLSDNQAADRGGEIAVAPGGVRYEVNYRSEPSRRSHGILGIPREVIIAAALGGLLFSAVLAWYLTQPIRRMQAGFGRLADGNLATRLGPEMGRRRDEIADLAHDFDRMAVRLEELVAARDRLLADVSHELRTPLARLTLAIELARQDPSKLSASLDRIGGEAAKLDEMVGELLTLAKLESGQVPSEEYFSLADIVQAVTQDASYESGTRDIQVLVEAPDEELGEWIVRGNGKLISRAVENVVRNAVRYSPTNGKVRIALERDGGLFRLRVSDQGPGVPEDKMSTLFKPFGISADGFGFGLGLAIAQRAITVHHGAITARNHDHGLEIAIALPSAMGPLGSDRSFSS
ncbi:MAG TPA: ATP-binding protein [Rhizomicrobium sp.]